MILKVWILKVLQEGVPLPGPQTGPLSNTWKWIVQGDNLCWQSKRFYWERAPKQKAEGGGNPGEQLCHMACSPEFMVMGLVSGLSLASHSDSRVLPGGAALFSQGGCQRGIQGGGWTVDVSFWSFLNCSGWWRLISSLFLSSTSCHKTSHTNSYYGAWPGWVISISVLPLTKVTGQTCDQP